MEKRGLGKGLGALIPGAERAERGSSLEVEIDKITLNPFQPRESVDEEKLKELVNSVRVHGVLQPVVVRAKGDGKYELVAGERRLRAAIAAGLARIPVVVRELTDEQSLEVALIENIQREDISPVDAALAYRRLQDEFGLSQEELALGLGKSRSAVANTMRLLNLPEPVLRDLRAGRIAEGHARAILSLEDEGLQVELSRRVSEAGLSVRDAERMAREWARGTAPETPRADVSRETSPPPDPNLQEIEARLREILGTKVSVIKNKDRGRIEIEFYSDDDLERILALLAGF